MFPGGFGSGLLRQEIYALTIPQLKELIKSMESEDDKEEKPSLGYIPYDGLQKMVDKWRKEEKKLEE